MEVREKLSKLIEHWLHHQQEHRESYERWASEAEQAGLTEAAKTLRAIATETEKTKQLLQEALQQIKSKEV